MAQTESWTKPVKPYSWYHPVKSWTDIFLSFLFPLLNPVDRVLKLVAIDDKKNVIQTKRELRARLDIVAALRLKSNASPFRQWAKSAGCHTVEVHYEVLRVKIYSRNGVLERRRL